MTRSTLAACVLLPTLACAHDTTDAPDARVVYGVLDTEIFLYDQLLVGQPSGNQDISGDCPLGGTVHVVGTTAQAESASVDLVFSLTDCANVGAGYDLALTGDLSMSGSFSSSGYKALATASDALTVTGTADAIDVDDTCVLAVTDQGSAGEASHVAGEWCGRSVSF